MLRRPDVTSSIQNLEEEDEPLLGEEGGYNMSNSPPPDIYHFSYISYVIFGLAALLPWNIFITASAYFKEKLKPGSDFVETRFENCFAISSQVTNVLFLLINVKLQNRFSAFSRIMVSLLLMLAMFILTTIMVKVDTDSWTDWFFGLTIAIIVLFNACSGVFSGGIFGMAASFTPHHTQGFMSGQGLGGLFASIASIISLAVTNGKDPYDSGFYYFVSASMVIALALGIYPVFLNLRISKYYLERVTDELSHSFMVPNISVLQIVKQIKWMLFSVFMTFLITLSVFPSVLSEIKPNSSTKLGDTYFTPVTCFLLFNLGDFIGRTVAGSFQVLSKRWLIILSVARVVFIPLFIFCNCRPGDKRSLHVWFKNDAYPIVFTLLCSLTNGYFASLAMMYGPQLVPKGPEQAAAGACMAFGLGLGLMCGAFLSFGVVSII